MECKYRITVRSLKGPLLIFKQVPSYKVVDGLVIFQNVLGRGEIKRYAVSNCEIEEEKEEAWNSNVE